MTPRRLLQSRWELPSHTLLPVHIAHARPCALAGSSRDSWKRPGMYTSSAEPAWFSPLTRPSETHSTCYPFITQPERSPPPPVTSQLRSSFVETETCLNGQQQVFLPLWGCRMGGRRENISPRPTVCYKSGRRYVCLSPDDDL